MLDSYIGIDDSEIFSLRYLCADVVILAKSIRLFILDNYYLWIVLLQELFAAEILKKDEKFFLRLKESALLPEDSDNRKHNIFFDDEFDSFGMYSLTGAFIERYDLFFESSDERLEFIKFVEESEDL
jgi:hypothetical protein